MGPGQFVRIDIDKSSYHHLSHTEITDDESTKKTEKNLKVPMLQQDYHHAAKSKLASSQEEIASRQLSC
jgi:hypothetical protein